MTSNDWDWSYAWRIFPDLARGLGSTITVSLIASAGALALGLAWALIAYSEIPVLSLAIRLIVQFLRGTPLLVQLYFAYYVLPNYNIHLSAFATGALVLAISFSAYYAEIFRAGVLAVPRGQWEVSKALGFGAFTTWRRVILPDVWRRVIPPIGSYVILTFKESALLAAITVSGLMTVAFDIGSNSFRYIEPLTIAGLLYLLVSLVSALALRILERRLTHV